jgi:hypothetical protein
VRSWSDEEVEHLIRLWNADELSASEIGTLLGRSRNSIIGCVHRLKLPPKQPGVLPRNRRRLPKKVRLKVVPLFPPRPPVQLTLIEPRPSVVFLERHSWECGFIPDSEDGVPIQQRKCCGAEVVPDQPFKFCSYHLSVTTQQRRKVAA